MKKTLLTFAAALLPLGLFAQSTYTTTNGTVNLVAGLTNLTSFTAINTTNQSVGIDYITDSSWSTTIANLGGIGNGTPTGAAIPGGTLAGTFGGSTLFASSHSILLIGMYGTATNAPTAWGAWTVRLLLSDDSYSSAISFTDSDLIRNPSVMANPSVYNNLNGATVNPGPFPSLYQELNIAAFDTGNIGVKGIELSNFASEWPDISYISGAELVPEPSTYALLALSAAGLGAHVLRRRRK